MAEIKRSQVGFKEDVYDAWDSGARNGILHRKISLPSNPKFPLSPIQFSDESRRDKRWFKHYNYPKLAVELILSGAVEYRMEEYSLTASAGECCILLPGTTVTMVNSGVQWRRKLCLIIDGLALETLLSAFGFSKSTIIKVPAPEELASFMCDIGDMMERSESSVVDLSAAVYRLLAKLSCSLVSENILSPTEKAVKFMQRNLHQPIKMEDLAAIAGCSEATLRRYFYREFKASPFAFLKEMRLRKGAEILKLKNNISIKMLSYECGFSSVPSFIKAFKDHYGITPGVWKKQK